MSMTEGYRSTIVDDDATEPRTVEFYLGAHLTFTVDETGKVTHVAIMPYQEPPSCESRPDWAGDYDDSDGADIVDVIEERAGELGWTLPTALPDSFSWEL